MKKIILIIIIISFSIFACTNDFEETNINPLAANEVPSTMLLTNALQELINNNSSLGYNKTFMLYSQQWAQRETTTRSLYGIGSTSSDWNSWYLNGLPELVEIIKLNKGDDKDLYSPYGKNENQIAVAMILKTWVFHTITDTWGDIPFSQTFDIENYPTPKYDKQKDIYTDLLQNLKDAVAMIDESASGFKSGDLMYNGDMTKWKAFANSLRARIAMRMSEVDPVLAKSEVSDALSSIVFMSNDDNAKVFFQNQTAHANPLFIEFKTQKWTFTSEPLIDLMNSYGSGTATIPSDPRITKYASPNIDNDYIGFPYGLTTSATFNYGKDERSLPNEMVRSIDFPSYIMTYSELLFIKAEAEQRGWFGATTDAIISYNDAITASMQQWNIDNTAINNYLALADVQYNASNWRKMIGEQKYIALYTQGANAWNEWRRLDFPLLDFPINAIGNSTEIPRRFFYPSSEASVNDDNLQAAIIQMGGDTFSTRMWWDQ